MAATVNVWSIEEGLCLAQRRIPEASGEGPCIGVSTSSSAKTGSAAAAATPPDHYVVWKPAADACSGMGHSAQLESSTRQKSS